MSARRPTVREGVMRLGALTLGFALVSSTLGAEAPAQGDERFCTWVSTMWQTVEADHAVLVVATGVWRRAYHVDLPFYDPPDPEVESQFRLRLPSDSTTYWPAISATRFQTMPLRLTKRAR